jgi:hypothetical protein
MFSTEKLCDQLPQCFYLYLNYCKQLKYEEKPDYQYLRGLFESYAKDNEIKLSYDLST